jgi:hypothetical protein
MVEVLNDSKQIGVCIYNVLTLSVLGTAVSLLVDDDIDITYGFTSAIVLVGTTLIQCILFVPKVNQYSNVVATTLDLGNIVKVIAIHLILYCLSSTFNWIYSSTCFRCLESEMIL